MKAKVEFEVTKCRDCLLSINGPYDGVYCIHPEIDCLDIDFYFCEDTFPEWCPLMKQNDCAWIEDRTEIVCPHCGARFDDEIRYMMENEEDMKYCPACGRSVKHDL